MIANELMLEMGVTKEGVTVRFSFGDEWFDIMPDGLEGCLALAEMFKTAGESLKSNSEEYFNDPTRELDFVSVSPIGS